MAGKNGLLNLTSLVVGTIVGAGVLGIPYVASQSGFLIASVEIIIIGVIMVVLNLMLLAVGHNAKQSFQLVGLAGRLFGAWGKIIMSGLYIVSLVGAITAYIIGEGAALEAIFKQYVDWPPIVWSIIFFAVFAPMIRVGIKTIERAEFFLILFLTIVVVLISVFSAPSFNTGLLTDLNLNKAFVPFGVIFFAMWGVSAVPPVLASAVNIAQARKGIIIGTIIPAVLYIVFVGTVLAVTGGETTEIATLGLGMKLGKSMLIFGNLFAAFAMGTSFLGIGLALKEVFLWDFKLPHNTSWAIAVFAPFIFFLFGGRNFISILEFTGSYILTATAIMIVLMYIKSKV